MVLGLIPERARQPRNVKYLWKKDDDIIVIFQSLTQDEKMLILGNLNKLS